MLIKTSDIHIQNLKRFHFFISKKVLPLAFFKFIYLLCCACSQVIRYPCTKFKKISSFLNQKVLHTSLFLIDLFIMLRMLIKTSDVQTRNLERFRFFLTNKVFTLLFFKNLFIKAAHAH